MPLPVPIAVDCPMAEVLDLRADPLSAPIRGPAGFGAVVPMAPGPLPPPGKVWFGTPSGETLESDNFGVVWQPGEATHVEAQAAVDALEAAWDEAVVQGNWLQPWSSQDYLLWVVLDPYLGVDGRTEAVPSADFPDGVPVLSLDPAGHADPDRFAVTAAHQFHHALHLRLRKQDTGNEAWFWESSASWGAARALTGNPARYADARGFLDDPTLSLDAGSPAQHRGLLLLNAWLDQSEGWTTRALWEVGRLEPETPWETVLVDATGHSAGTLFAGFSGAAANGVLDDSALIGELVPQGPLDQGVTGSLARLGVDGWTWTGAEPVEVRLSGALAEADVVLASATDQGPSVVLQPGEVVTVSASTDAAGYVLYFEGVDSGSQGADRPTGRADESTEAAVQGSCACSSGGGSVGWLGWIGLVALWRRRP